MMFLEHLTKQLDFFLVLLLYVYVITITIKS